jgi:hypothetical protein
VVLGIKAIVFRKLRGPGANCRKPASRPSHALRSFEIAGPPLGQFEWNHKEVFQK